MIDGNEEYTISDYVSHHFVITIGETWTCLTFHSTKTPQTIQGLSIYFIFGRNIKGRKKYKKNQSLEK